MAIDEHTVEEAVGKVFGELGVDLNDQPSRRQLLRFCVDWSGLFIVCSSQSFCQ